MAATKKVLLRGSGELGREFVISAKRLGAHVVACDAYVGAPAMQVADEAEVFSTLGAAALGAAIDKHKPDFIVPEIEAIRTEVLKDYEDRRFRIVPSARATMMTMNRDPSATWPPTTWGCRPRNTSMPKAWRKCARRRYRASPSSGAGCGGEGEDQLWRLSG